VVTISVLVAAVVTYRCPRCDRYLQESSPGDIKKIHAGSGFVRACAACGSALVQETSRAARSLPGLLAGAFVYPFKGSTLMWVAAIVVGTTVLSFVPVIGGLLALSAELGFLFTVLKSTAEGSDELKVDTSELSDVSTWIRPIAKYFFAFLISFGPAVVAALVVPREPGQLLLAVYALGAAGLVYFPAALVLAAHETGCLGVLNPVAGVQLIARVPGPYFVTVFFVGVAAAIGGLMTSGASMVAVPLLGGLLRSVAALYAPVVAMRMLGLLVEENAEAL
jgi:hypothetical protein